MSLIRVSLKNGGIFGLWPFMIFFTMVFIQSQKQTTTVLVVNTTAESGQGSLPQAIADANSNPGPDNIHFDIPVTDPGFVAYADDFIPASFDPLADTVPANSPEADPDSPRWWQIALNTLKYLPKLIDDDTTIDATTQAATQGNKNPYGPEIQLANINKDFTSGIWIEGNGCTVRGLAINGFFTAILITGVDNLVAGNYLGTEPSGQHIGLFFSQHNAIEILGNMNTVGGSEVEDRNLINGGNSVGLRIETDNNDVLGNYIGINATATGLVSNGPLSVDLIGSDNYFAGNVIGGSFLAIQSSSGNIFERNFIGTDSSQSYNFGTWNHAFFLRNTTDNRIGPGNVIWHSNGPAIHIEEPESDRNTITQNSISLNNGPGIELLTGANNNIVPPVIAFAYANLIMGEAQPFSLVEIFSDPFDEGLTYEDTVNVGETGWFVWHGTAAGPFITATASDAEGNTSAFSAPLSLQTTPAGFQLIPAVYNN